MRATFTTRPSTSVAARRTMKSASPVASGPMTRSTDECEMSRSCQSATSSSAADSYDRSSRARPHRFSDRIGFFLCGIADEPFCPLPKASFASPTSVRCQWRTVDRDALDGRAQPRQRLEESRVPIARRRSASAPSRARSPSVASAFASIAGSRLA